MEIIRRCLASTPPGWKRVSDELFPTYKSFIPRETRIKNRNVADRILVTERSAFETMWEEWDTEAWHLSLSGNERAISLRTGGVIIFDDPNKLWRLCTPDLQKKLIAEYDTEERARQIVVRIAFYDVVAHEVVHQFQYPHLPEIFLECAVGYYQRETVQKLGGGYLTDAQNIRRIEFYKEMLAQYGDELHNLFFNGNVDPEKQQEIYRKFLEVEDKLFPSGEGLMSG